MIPHCNANIESTDIHHELLVLPTSGTWGSCRTKPNEHQTLNTIFPVIKYIRLLKIDIRALCILPRPMKQYQTNNLAYK